MSFQTISNKLLPFRDNDPHEEINLFALDGVGTGLAGTLVEMVSFNPDNTDEFSSIGVGFQPDGTQSVRYNVLNKMKPSTSGAPASKILGIQLYDVREYDENGNKLIFNPQKQEEMKVLLSGQAVPVLKRGLVTLRRDAFVGTPSPGFVGVVDSVTPGVIRAVDPSGLKPIGWTGEKNGAYYENQVVGRFISSTGSSFNGYALFEVSV